MSAFPNEKELIKTLADNQVAIVLDVSPKDGRIVVKDLWGKGEHLSDLARVQAALLANALIRISRAEKYKNVLREAAKEFEQEVYGEVNDILDSIILF